MEKPTRERLLDAALELLGEGGSKALTVRAAEDRAGVPHGSVRHHLGSFRGLVLALPGHLATVEGAAIGEGAAAAVAHWTGPGRVVALARYELVLLAARDDELRAAMLAGRERFVALAAERVGPGPAAQALVAALDGVVLDALLRGRADPEVVAAALGGPAG